MVQTASGSTVGQPKTINSKIIAMSQGLVTSPKNSHWSPTTWAFVFCPRRLRIWPLILGLRMNLKSQISRVKPRWVSLCALKPHPTNRLFKNDDFTPLKTNGWDPEMKDSFSCRIFLGSMIRCISTIFLLVMTMRIQVSGYCDHVSNFWSVC